MSRFSFPLAVAATGLLFATVVLLPHLLQRTGEDGERFQGIEIMGIDAETYYAARERDTAEGFPRAANAWYADLKDEIAMQPALPEWVIATSGKFVGLSPLMALVISKGVFALLLVVVMTGFLASVAGGPESERAARFRASHKWTALVAVAVLLFAGSVLSAPWDLPTFLRDPSFSYGGFLRFGRPINPQWSTAFFFLTLWLLASWMQERRSWKVVLASLATVANLYAYVYAWNYIGLVAVLLLWWYAWKRDWRRVRDLLLFGLIFLLLGIPYFLNLWQLLHHPWYPASAMRQGLAPRHTPVIGAWLIALLVASFASKRVWTSTWPLLPVVAVSGLVAINHQVITGQYLVPHHYHWYFIHPLGVMIAFALLFALAARSLPRTLTQVALTLVFVLSFAFGWTVQVREYALQRQYWLDRQATAPVLKFLAEHTTPGTVVFATKDAALREYIVIYTPADVYSSQSGNLGLVSHERVEDALFFDLWLAGLSHEDAEARFLTDLTYDVSSRLFAIYYRERGGGITDVPKDILQREAAAYRRYARLSFEEKFRRYPMRLAVFVPGDEWTPELRTLKDSGTVVYDRDGYAVVSFVSR